MADRQFVIGGVEPAPAAWDIPAALQLNPKTARASFDGSGAAGSFKPCLRIVSDSGHVVLESVTAETVAAGGSADVSWFQGGMMGAGAAAASGSVVACQMFKGATTYVVGSNHVVVWETATFLTNDPATFTLPSGTPLNLAHGGLVMTGIVVQFGPDGGVPYTGAFELQTEMLDSGSTPVQGLTSPNYYTPELYGTDPTDEYNPNGYAFFNADDSTYTPPYTLKTTITNLTKITTVGMRMMVAILTPTGLT